MNKRVCPAKVRLLNYAKFPDQWIDKCFLTEVETFSTTFGGFKVVYMGIIVFPDPDPAYEALTAN